MKKSSIAVIALFLISFFIIRPVIVNATAANNEVKYSTRDQRGATVPKTTKHYATTTTTLYTLTTSPCTTTTQPSSDMTSTDPIENAKSSIRTATNSLRIIARQNGMWNDTSEDFDAIDAFLNGETIEDIMSHVEHLEALFGDAWETRIFLTLLRSRVTALLDIETTTMPEGKTTIHHSTQPFLGHYPIIGIVNNPGTRKVSYGDSITLTAKTSDMLSDDKILWYINGTESGEGVVFTYSNVKADATITVKIVDKNGNIHKDSNGGEISESEKITVKSGFFQKLISFIKNLFKANRIVVQ